MTLTATSPATHPTANAVPLERARGVPSTSTIATIGIGLRATATAAGRKSPIAWVNTGYVASCGRYPRSPTATSTGRRAESNWVTM